MGIVVVPTFGADPVTITGPTLDAKVDGLATEFNGNIDNDNLDSAAAIANSKLNLSSISQNITHSGTMTHSGTLTMTAKDISEAKGADVASATTTTIWVGDGNFIHITGTTTITGFGTAGQAGDERTIVFDGALTLTHNATSLILPTGANITTVAGDTALVRAETTANARVIAYLRKDGTAVAGAFTPSVSNALSSSVIQTVITQNASVVTCNATTPVDNTIPQVSETTAYTALNTSITPSNASNTLVIRVNINGTHNSGAVTVVALFQDATAGALYATRSGSGASFDTYGQSFTFKMTAGTTSSTTFKIGIGTASGTFYTNADFAGNALFGGVYYSTIEIIEIKA